MREMSIEYDVILWSRRNAQFEQSDNHYVFKSQTKKSRLSKIIPFIKWRHFCLKILKHKKYDKLIILTTIPGVLLSWQLFRRYKGKYIFDIRDFTYENIRIFSYIVSKLVEFSAFTTISSPKFKSWLKASDKILVTHNILNEGMKSEIVQIPKDKIRIGFLGGLRYYNENVLLINQVKNDSRIELHYIGKKHPGKDLELFCKLNSIKNVMFFPPYNNEDKPKLYKNIDFINSIYGSKSLEVSTALPNKLYDCVLYKKPIIVSTGTYLAEVVDMFFLGFSIDIEREDFIDKLNEYVINFDEEKFIFGCEKYMNQVMSEEECVKLHINKFLKVDNNL